MPITTKLTLLDVLVNHLLEAGIYNRNDQVAPTAVLWPDEQQQWLRLIPLLRERLPLLTLGAYDPENRIGPAYWIRCMIARTLPEDTLPDDETPIIYLPGHGKQDLRAIEECPKPLQPLAELQYRGTLWVHANGRDWTVTGFLHNLDVPVGADNETKKALVRALPRLVREPLARLQKRAPLDAAFFNELLHPDAVRQILLWLSDPQAFQEQLADAEWAAFRALCRQKYDVEPAKDGPLSVAQHLADQAGEWSAVWERYVEAPEAYPGLPKLLEHAQPRQLSLLEPSPVWPEGTKTSEVRLREALTSLREKHADEVRQTLAKLEDQHGRRREWVWTKLGQAPLALALKHLVSLAQLTQKPLGGSDVTAVAENYTSWGWQVDAAVLDALAEVQHHDDVKAVKNAILPVYRPWLEQAAARMQDAVFQNPSENYAPAPPPLAEKGTCLLFSDALRYDAARSLAEVLQQRGFDGDTDWRLAALPTVTATAKPAVSPAADQVQGSEQPGLDPVAATTGTQISAGSLRALIASAGYQVLQGDDLGDPAGRAWLETGAIDKYGHEHGWKVARHVRDEVHSLANRVESLLAHGWQKVVVVTDHGWLLLPDDLPKAELPIHITKLRKGRCAVLKQGTSTEQQVIPWHWNADVRIAVAPGIHCFEKGKEYEHGGISPQECIVPVLIVTTPVGETVVTITEVKWRGLRGVVQLEGATEDMEVDIRVKAGDPKTSVVLEPKGPDEEGNVSLLVPNEEHEGQAAFVVVTVGDSLRAQKLTIIGGE